MEKAAGRGDTRVIRSDSLSVSGLRSDFLPSSAGNSGRHHTRPSSRERPASETEEDEDDDGRQELGRRHRRRRRSETTSDVEGSEGRAEGERRSGRDHHRKRRPHRDEEVQADRFAHKGGFGDEMLFGAGYPPPPHGAGGFGSELVFDPYAAMGPLGPVPVLGGLPWAQAPSIGGVMPMVLPTAAVGGVASTDPVAIAASLATQQQLLLLQLQAVQQQQAMLLGAAGGAADLSSLFAASSSTAMQPGSSTAQEVLAALQRHQQVGGPAALCYGPDGASAYAALPPPQARLFKVHSEPRAMSGGSGGAASHCEEATPAPTSRPLELQRPPSSLLTSSCDLSATPMRHHVMSPPHSANLFSALQTRGAGGSAGRLVDLGAPQVKVMCPPVMLPFNTADSNPDIPDPCPGNSKTWRSRALSRP